MMEPGTLADKIVAARKSKGYSQAALAERAGINLRTIQRIEKGETTARGHTLQQLAKALDMEPADLHPPAITASAADHNLYLRQLNLSALACLVLPYGNIIIPYLLWRNKRAVMQEAEMTARRILNFQVLWSVVLSMGLAITAFVQMAFVYFFNIKLAFALFAVFLFLYILNIVTILFYAVQLRKGNTNIYPIGINVF